MNVPPCTPLYPCRSDVVRKNNSLRQQGYRHAPAGTPIPTPKPGVPPTHGPPCTPIHVYILYLLKFQFELRGTGHVPPCTPSH